MDNLVRSEIYNFERVGAQRSDEQPLTIHVHRQVVDPALNTRQRNCFHQAKRFSSRCYCRPKGSDTQSSKPHFPGHLVIALGAFSIFGALAWAFSAAWRPLA